jgi:hypothetical protein
MTTLGLPVMSSAYQKEPSLDPAEPDRMTCPHMHMREAAPGTCHWVTNLRP